MTKQKFRWMPSTVSLKQHNISLLLTYQPFTAKPLAMAAQGPMPGPRYKALLQILRTAEALWNSSRQFFARWDLSPSQFNILNLLYHAPAGYSQVELSRELIMHRSNVTGLIDRLEERGLVCRHNSAEDRRAYRVLLTPAGTKLMKQILPKYYAAAEQVWGNFPQQQAEQLVADLSKLSTNAQQIGHADT